MRYTPGPWEITTTDYQPPGYPRGIIKFAEGPGGNEVIAPNVNSEANARLIAAAPDLLEALLRLMAWSVGGNALTKHQDVYAQARAAVDKAVDQ